VARLKGEQTTPPISVELRLDFIRAVPDDSSSTTAALTPAYVPDERLRVAIYRRMAEATSQEGLNDLALELADRFGPPPPPVQRLLAIAGLRVTAASAGIELIEVKARKIMIRRGGEFHMENGRFPLLRAASPDNAITELRDRIANL
jgi:transcription-repair coupling factor (superfamily II helicase)